jgi:hypothetical protein
MLKGICLLFKLHEEVVWDTVEYIHIELIYIEYYVICSPISVAALSKT